MNNISEIKGVIPAMITTFDENEELDLKRAAILVEYLIEQGAGALYITGSTGEGFFMDMAERKAYAEFVVKAVNKRIPVIVHIGNIGTKKSIELAKHAQSIDADAISSVPPFYYNYSNENIYDYYKDISDSVDLPMIVYNISLAGIMNNDLILQLATIKNVKGLKFTGRNLDDLSLLKLKLGENFMIYSGCDEMATQGLLSGADGIIGSTYNLMCSTNVKIFNLAREHKFYEAFEIQKVVTSLIHELLKYDFFPTLKSCMRHTGLDIGYGRKPFNEPTKAQFDRLLQKCRLLKSNKYAKEIEFLNTI